MRRSEGEAPRQFSAERQLLLHTARIEMDEGHSAAIKELARRPLDWPGMIREANQQGLAPLLFSHINQLCPESVPGATLQQLRQRFQYNARHNLLLTAQLLRLLRLFEEHGIKVLPLKGPVLAHTVYGSISLRQIGDLDLLARPEDAEACEQVLMAHGYQPTASWSRAQRSSHRRVFYHNTLRHEQLNVVVELHWAVAPRSYSAPIDTDLLWSRLESTEISGQAVATPRAEDQLLLLCVHGSRHGWARLEWICGVAELCRKQRRLDWDDVIETARRRGSERMLAVGLLLAHRLLDAPVPADVLRLAAWDRVAQHLALYVERETLFVASEEEASTGVRGFVFHWRMRERAIDRLRFGVRELTSPSTEDWEWLPLPAGLLGLYPLLRPIRLAQKHARRLWQPGQS